MYHFQVIFGFKKRKPEWYWCDKIDAELKFVINDIGKFPTQKRPSDARQVKYIQHYQETW